jgi:hypothetical protein
MWALELNSLLGGKVRFSSIILVIVFFSSAIDDLRWDVLKQWTIIFILGFFRKPKFQKNKETAHTSPPPFLMEGKLFGSGAMISAVLNLYPREFSVG